MAMRGLAGLLACWFVGALALTGCGAPRPTPTLVPTLTLPPTPALTPSPFPTLTPSTPTPIAPSFPAWRTVTLQSDQSFDFRQEKTGAFTEGDFYFVAFSPTQGTACFWANNAHQVGGRDLGPRPLSALVEYPSLPRDRFSRQCNAVMRGHMYVYGMRGDERLAVFRVADNGLDWVTFDFVLRR
jgi:hypothetical protein